MANRRELPELVSVDATIDAIAREAFAEARHVEEAERYRNNPGPVGPPRSGHVALSESPPSEGVELEAQRTTSGSSC